MSTEAAAGASLEEMKLLDPDILKCPYHYDKTLREQAPVHQDPETGVYIVSTYELVRQVQKAKDVFSNEFTLALGSTRKLDPAIKSAMDETYNLGKGTLLTVDDPDHGEYRDAVKDFFLADNIKGYEPWITEFANSIVDKMAAKGQCNFIEEFARPLPLSVIMHVLGIPLSEFDRAFQWTLDNVAILSQMGTTEEMIEAQKGLIDQNNWFAAALTERKENPCGDLLSLVAHTKFRGRDTTMEEQLSYCAQFLVAGNETTTATLAEGMRQLCLHPEQEAMIRADRSLIPNLVEESLRLASPTSNMWRVALADYELGGVSIPQGSMVLLKYFSSNHDESMFEEPMKFDVTRSNLRRQGAFGFGIHVCIGQHLSKLEMIVGWQVLFERIDNFQLAVAADELEYMPNVLLRGLEEIPITYTAKS
jgi:cytochrome P450 family 142 subfamily A polypeptide 1